MGQYYRIVNLTKKEYLEPWSYNCGAKLMESSYIDRNLKSNPYISAFCGLLCNEWKGDEIIVAGDYADLPTEEDIKERRLTWPWDEILLDVQERYPELDLGKDVVGEYGEYRVTLYDAADSFKQIKMDKYNDFDIPQYLCNSVSGEYIDLKDLPIEWPAEGEHPSVSINPLPLLLALGNGLGGGDYRGVNEYLVGSWASEKYTKGIFFSDSVPEGFEKFEPDFTERQEVLRDEREV